MKILLLGPNGQVGWELQRSLASLGKVIAIGRQGGDGLAGDLSNPETLAGTVKTVSPDIIVNAAAYTAVDRAESEPEQTRLINAEGPARLAQEAKRTSAWLVHYSTDYVFNGTGSTPWQEDDPTGPINVYGQTKLEGEEAIRQTGCHHLIFRTSWVYAAHGKNFIHTMLKLASERENLNVIDDQIGAPTGAELIADVTAHAIRSVHGNSNLAGIYHLAASGETTWFDYARLIIGSGVRAGMNLKVSGEDIMPVPSERFPTPAPRPRNSRLDCSRLEQAFGLKLPDWKKGVQRVISEIALMR